MHICLFANTINYPQGGGHLWVHLNWALGFRSLGCKVTWHERLHAGGKYPFDEAIQKIHRLKKTLAQFGLADCLSVSNYAGEDLPVEVAQHALSLAQAAQADLLFSLCYEETPCVVRHFRRTAMLDIDPGQLQVYMKLGTINLTPHDYFFTIGETVGQPGSLIPDVGVKWHYTPPCVDLHSWPVHPSNSDAPFTTISHWFNGEWVPDGKGGHYNNEKRTAFLPFLNLPSRVSAPLELALCLATDEREKVELENQGWRIKEAWDVSSTAQDYQQYIRASRGEFSCVKPQYIRLETAWISDRTICYLASGKPAILQYDGPSRVMPDAGGIFRFRDYDEAVRCFEIVSADFENQCVLARQLAEQHFDARKVTRRVLEIATS